MQIEYVRAEAMYHVFIVKKIASRQRKALSPVRNDEIKTQKRTLS